MVIWNFLKNKRHAFAKFLPQLIDLHFKHSHFTLWLYMFQCYLFHYHHQSLAAKYTTKRWTIHRNVYLLPHYYNIILQILWMTLEMDFWVPIKSKHLWRSCFCLAHTQFMVQSEKFAINFKAASIEFSRPYPHRAHDKHKCSTDFRKLIGDYFNRLKKSTKYSHFQKFSFVLWKKM